MFKVLDTVCQPTRATKYSAMVDLYAREDVVIGAGETKIVPLGVKIDRGWFPNMYPIDIESMEKCMYDFYSTHYLELHPRSSLRAKGLIIGVGVIDLDYPDEIGLIVHNPIGNEYESHILFDEWGTCTIKKGDKVAQCTLKEHKGYLLGIESGKYRDWWFWEYREMTALSWSNEELYGVNGSIFKEMLPVLELRKELAKIRLKTLVYRVDNDANPYALDKDGKPKKGYSLDLHIEAVKKAIAFNEAMIDEIKQGIA